MNDIFRAHKILAWSVAIVGALLLAIVLFAVLFTWNGLRPWVAHEITAKTGRPASINGDLKVHLFSWNPNAEINGVSIENPTWAGQHVMFAAQRISVSVSLGRLLRGQIVIPQLELIEPTINLERDSKGHASWELGGPSGTPNGNKQPAKIPTIQRLLIQNGKMHVVDEIRRLRFAGSLVAAEEAGVKNASAFRIEAKGSLNNKPFSMDGAGGPLFNLEPDKPYSFSLHVTASDIVLAAKITLPKPFDLSLLDVQFDVSGKDLADGYYLTGLALPNTPPYRLSALVHASNTTYRLDNLSGRLGSSDVAGKIVVETGRVRPKLTAKLVSNTLDMVDVAPTLGKPADNASGLSAATAPPQSQAAKSARLSNRAPTAAAPGTDRAQNGLLLPDADLQVNRVRGMDADVTYRAKAVTAPKVPMKEVSFHLILDDGLLTMDPLSFDLDQGKFAGSVRIDARQDLPQTTIDMAIDGVDLSQFKTKSMTEPPLSGSLMGRVKIKGVGTSIHKLASTMDGQVSIVIPHGEINQALAELTGINVTRGLGLLIRKDETKTSIRCGVLNFQAQQGALNAKNLFMDTTDVLIQGSGDIQLRTENLDLAIHGDPKKLRLTRVRAPITVKGTLRHPAIGVDAGKLAGQGAVAAALGMLLTPVAAVIAFIDPGRAKNKDCATSVDEASAPIRN
jgi:uncharacterized protein involved in outer membrane biogenesis